MRICDPFFVSEPYKWALVRPRGRPALMGWNLFVPDLFVPDLLAPGVAWEHCYRHRGNHCCFGFYKMFCKLFVSHHPKIRCSAFSFCFSLQKHEEANDIYKCSALPALRVAGISTCSESLWRCLLCYMPDFQVFICMHLHLNHMLSDFTLFVKQQQFHYLLILNWIIRLNSVDQHLWKLTCFRK